MRDRDDREPPDRRTSKQKMDDQTSRRTNNLDPRHPWMRQDRDTQMIIISRPGRTRYTVHPLQMEEYIAFDRRVRDSAAHTHQHLIIPAGYLQIAEILNSIPEYEYPYRLVTYDSSTGQYVIPRRVARSQMVTTNFLDPRYRELGNLGLISPTGDLDNRGIQDISAALRRPHGENNDGTIWTTTALMILPDVSPLVADPSPLVAALLPHADAGLYLHEVDALLLQFEEDPFPLDDARILPIIRARNVAEPTMKTMPVSFTQTLFDNSLATFPAPVIAAPIDFLQSPPSIMPAVSSALADIISQAEAGPGPSTMMNQQITSATTNPQSLPTPTSIIHPSSPLSDFLNIDGDAHMHEDDDHRDDFLRDFENL
ncbi:hypothetical protein H0H92_011068 [Tricholoma furcatifolium]|nr:hypothetical protein H0H92_011068 [Tricholoma furcatifolium]